MLNTFEKERVAVVGEAVIEPGLLTDNELQLLDEIAAPPTELAFYSDQHIQIGETVFELDDVSEKFLKVLVRHPEGISVETMQDHIFGGYKQYMRPSAAQLARLDATIDYLARVEVTSQQALFSAYTREQEPGSLYVEPRFTITFLRKPFIEQPSAFKQPAVEVVDEKPDILDDLQHQIAGIIADPSTHDRYREGRIYTKVLFHRLFNGKRPTFEEEVAVNQALESLINWLSSHSLGLQLSKGGGIQGPTLEIDNIFEIEDFLDEIAATEQRIAAEFVIAQEKAAAEKMAQGSTQSRAKTKVTIPSNSSVRKQVEHRTVHPLAKRFSFPPFINDRDRNTIEIISREINMATEEVMAVRQLLSRTLHSNVLPTGNEQVSIIRFIQIANQNQDKLAANKQLQIWAQAAFHVMVIRYERVITTLAKRHANGFEDRVDGLKNAGIYGMFDAIVKYSELRGQPTSYIGIRVLGEIIEYSRKAAWGSRNVDRRLSVVSLETPIHSVNNGSGRGAGIHDHVPTIGDTLGELWDISATDAFDTAENNHVMLPQLLAAGLTEVRRRFGKHDRNLECDIQLTLLYFGAETCMQPVDLELYHRLQQSESPGTDLSLALLGEYYGVSESRASQIVKDIKSKLKLVLAGQKEDILSVL